MVMTATLVLSLNYLYQIPRRAIVEFLEELRQNRPKYGLSSPSIQSIARDPRTYEKVIGINIEQEQRAICPGCGTSYPLQNGGIPSVNRCEARGGHDSNTCGRELCYTRGNQTKPLLLLRRRCLGDWLQGLLGRHGILEKVESVWRKAQRRPPDIVEDIWDGSFIRTLIGPDKSSPISLIPEKEIRVLLSLSVDWFNPFHNKIAGKTASTGVIFMTCLNLPPEERCKEENIFFVSVLPGRKQQPYLDGVLSPLVNELLQYWEDGVYFAGLPSDSEPRLVRCALVQLICDLPAARKIAGFPSHSATCHCSVCFSTRQKMDFSSGYDQKMRRNLEDHMSRARNYKAILETDGRRAAESLLKTDPRAVRWSPLNELPYWDPIRCTVIDTMHLVLLGLCQYHWRRFWGGDQIPEQSRDTSKSIPSRQTYGHAQFRVNSDSSDQIILPNHYNEQANNYDIGRESRDDHDQEHHDSGTIAHDHEPGVKFFKTLSSEKMNEARVVWVMRPSKAFSNLTNHQLLCLIQENGAKIPPKAINKVDLVQLLEVGSIIIGHNTPLTL
jgi:hypothetical protein